MDFQSMKRKQLQALCKKHNIPAHLSSLQLAQNLSSLLQEKQNPAKRARPSSNAVVETVEENDPIVAPRQLKKVRFSPNSEMFEFVQSGRKGKAKAKAKVMMTKSEMKLANNAAKVDAVESNEEVVYKAVRSLRSRVIASAGGGDIPVVKPLAEKKRVRKVGKDVDKVESKKEFVISPVRVTRSTMNTSTEDGIIPVSKQIVEKKRGRGVIKDVEAVVVVGSSPIRVTRSRAQISVEGGEVLASKPQVEKKRAREVVKDVDPAKDIVNGPVRTTRSRAQTSKEGFVATMPSSPVEKKRVRSGIKIGAKTVKSTDAGLDIPVTLVSQEAAADRAEDLPLKRTLRQKNQKHKAAKADAKVCEDEPLVTDIGMTKQKLCSRRMTRNAAKLGDSTVLNRSTDETEMGGRVKITRSRNQLASKDNSDMKTGTAVDQVKFEFQAGDPLGRTGRNYNRRKSVIPQQTGNGVKVQGTSQTIPKLEEPMRRRSRKGSKQISIEPNVDVLETTESMTEKVDTLKENEMIVPAVGPSRRSRRQTLQLESVALTNEYLPSRVTAGRKRSVSQSHKGFKPKVLVKGLRQDASGGKSSVPSAARSNSSMKQRGAGKLMEQTTDIKCAPIGEESAIRFTRSATRNKSKVAAHNSEKVARKKQQHCRTETPNSVVRTPSLDMISVSEGKPGLDAQFCMPQVTKSLSDHVSGSSQVIKSNNFKSRSEARKTQSSKQGVEEAQCQTSPSKSERFQTDDVAKVKEISMRKRRGGFIFKEVEKSSRRLTHSAFINEKNTEPDLPVKAAQEKVHGRSRPPKLVVDEDSASYGKPSIGAKVSVPEVLKGPSDLFAGCTDVIKDDSSKKSTDSSKKSTNRSTRSSKQVRLSKIHTKTSDTDVAKGKASSSKSGSSQTYDQQEGTELSVKTRRVNVAFQEVAVDFVCVPLAEESSRRLTRSALKGEKSAPANPTEKSAGKKKRLNRSEAPKLDVKVSSADGNLAAHGLANLDPQFLSPKDPVSATVSVGVVIDESSSKKRKTLFSGVPAAKQDGTEYVSAQISHMTEGKSPILNLEETSAAESERLQIDEPEKDIVDSINETIVASDVDVMQGQIVPSDESLHHTNASEIELSPEVDLSSIQNSPGQFMSTAVMSETESSNLAMEVPSDVNVIQGQNVPSDESLGGTNASEIELAPEIELSSIQKSPGQFTSTAVMCEPEARNLAMEVPSEVNVIQGQIVRSDESFRGTSTAVMCEPEARNLAMEVPSEVNVIQGQIVRSDESLRGTNASEIELAPEIELSSVQNSSGQFMSTAVMSEPEAPNLAIEVPSEVNVIQAQIVPSDESLRGTNANEIELAPEIELSSIQNSPGQFTSTAVMNELESPNLTMEAPSELGPSALKAAPSIAAVPERANNLGLVRGEMIEDDSNSEVKKSSMEFQAIEEGRSDDVHTETLGRNLADILVNRVALSASEPVRLQDRRDPQMEISAGEALLFAANMNIPIGVDRDHSGSQSVLRTGHSTKLADQEAVENLSIADDHTGFARTASYSPSKVREKDEASTCKVEDSLVRARSKLSANQDNNFFTKQLNPEIFDNEKNLEFAEPSPCKDEDSLVRDRSKLSANQDSKNVTKQLNPEIFDNEKYAVSAEHHESSSSPVRKSIELEVLLTEKSHTIDQSPLQVPVTIENATITLLSSSEEPPELDDGKGMVSTTSSYSEKQKGFINVLSGYEADDIGIGNASSIGRAIIEAQSFDRKKLSDGVSQEMQINDNQDSVKGIDVDDSLQVDKDIAHDPLTPLKDNNETRLGCANMEVGDYGFSIPESPDIVPAESQHAKHPSKDDQLQTTDYYQLKDLFETPASRVHSCEEETSTKVTEMMHLVLSRDTDPGTLESRDNTPLQWSLNATIDNKSTEDLVDDWREDPLQSFSANGSCISSKDDPACGSLAYSDKKTREIERNKDPEDYFEGHLENEIETYNSFAPLDALDFDGDEENISIYGGSNSVEAGENDLKEAISDERARNVDEPSDEQLHNNQGVIKEGHCNSSIGSSNKPSYGTKVHITTDKTNETDDFSCNLTDANTPAVLGEHRMDLRMKSQMFSTQEANCSLSDNKGDEAEKSSPGLSWEDNKVRENYTLCAEEQFGEPDKNIKLFYGGTSDVTFFEYEHTEGFNVSGDTEEYFESENTDNANVKESFDGMTQDEFFMEIDHDYTVVPEPGIGRDISRMEAKTTANVDDNKPMADQTCKEREKPQLGEAPLMNSRKGSPKTSPGTDTSPGPVHFALDRVQREKPDVKAEGHEYAKQLDSASIAIENHNTTATLMRRASSKPTMLIDMKENALNLKGEHDGILSSARLMTGRRALGDLEKK